jgi:hypothetical protein
MLAASAEEAVARMSRSTAAKSGGCHLTFDPRRYSTKDLIAIATIVLSLAAIACFGFSIR